jgi:hypothetical protein
VNFRFITHLDTLPVMPRLFQSAPQNWPALEVRGERADPMIGLGASLPLRGHSPITEENWLEDLPVKDLPPLLGGDPKPFVNSWDSMKRLLSQARKAIMADETARQYLSGKMGRAMISRLDPGSTIFWHDDNGPYHEKHVRFHVPLVTNPGCIMYSGPESLHMEVGALWFFNNRTRHSAANWGKHYRLHLIFEMRRMDPDTDD